jgi:uncharacterized protein (TIGR03437 family)
VKFFIQVLLAALAPVIAVAADCSKTSSGLKPLIAPFFTNYKTFPGGLYPNGSNERPAAHETGGRAQAASVRPRDAAGNPNDQNGTIVVLSIGLSTFQTLANSDPQKNPKVQIVDGTQNDWSAVEQRISAAGLTDAQVQAAWMELADANPALPFPDDSKKLQSETQSIIQMARTRYPNLRLVYLSSPIYGGYASIEPYAYESGFSMKWLIEAQINGDAALDYSSGKFPWLAWGPYLWADGTTLRGDGLVWNCADFTEDGIQPSAAGQTKVGQMLLDFFKNDTTTRPWFAVVPGQPPKTPAPTAVLNAAGFFATVAPGGIASIFGSDLASDVGSAAGLPLPYGINGTTVDVGGQPAPIYFVSPTQINFVAPAAVNGNNITITREGSTSTVITAQLALNSEGLFRIGSTTDAAALHADGTLISTQIPAHRGETIELYGTGKGIRNPAILAPELLPMVTVGGSVAQVQYYGPAPIYPGLDQLNITIPSDAPTGPAVAVIVLSGSVSSNLVTLAIQ